MSEHFKVAVRCRPMNTREKDRDSKSVITVNEHAGEITAFSNIPDVQPKTFTFDSVFGSEAKQMDLYNRCARPIIESVLDGYNGTIFAYGQTGAGKSFTMEGVHGVPELSGVIRNSFAHIFSHIAKADRNMRFLVRISYLEIYCEDIYDLVGQNPGKRPELKEWPDICVFVKDLSNHIVQNAEDVDRILTLGNRNRAVEATMMGRHTNRSHIILTATLECSEKGTDGKDRVRMGKLIFCELAGSEKQTKTRATGQVLKEATRIGLSLNGLSHVTYALTDPKCKLIPYRDSKVTRILQDSMGGNSKTLMIANVGPADCNYDESMNTLRFANRCKNIKNKARINEDPKDSMLRQLLELEKLEQLRKQLTDGELSKGNIEAAIAADQKKLEGQKNMFEEERRKFDDDLEKKEAELQRAHEERQRIQNELSAAEKKNIVYWRLNPDAQSPDETTAGNGESCEWIFDHTGSRKDRLVKTIASDRKKLDVQQDIPEDERKKIEKDLKENVAEWLKNQEEQQRFQLDFVAVKKKIIMGGENRLGSAEKLMELLEQSARELEKRRIKNQSQCD